MKKVLLSLSCVALFTLASCKKDYTCECSWEDLDGETQTESNEIKDAKKGDAEDACDKLDTAGGSEMSCELL